MDIELPSSLPDVSNKATLSKKQAPPTTCKICLSKATGYHYDVASCDGCKTFFRRVTIQNHNYTCKLDGECFDDLKLNEHIPVPKCQACRFKKCVKVGMNHRKVQCIAKNIDKPLQTIDSQIGELIDKMIRLDVQSEKFRDCAYNPDSYPSLKECIKQENSKLSLADKYGPMQGWPLQQTTIDEHCRLQKSENRRHQFMKKWDLYELLTQVELAKALPLYSALSESDKFYLARDTVLMSTHLTRAFYSFEQKSDRLMRPDGIGYYELPFQFYDEFRLRFRDISMRCLKAVLRIGIDRVEFVLLRALVLTNPGVPDISEVARKYLTNERHKYNNALIRYIMVKHGASGPSRFVNIIGLIDVLEHQQRAQRDLSNFINLTQRRPDAEAIIDDVMRH